MVKNEILLIDDNPVDLELYKTAIETSAIGRAVFCQDSREAETELKKAPYAAVVLDLHMPFVSGEVLLEHIHQEYPELPVIVVTGEDTVETAVSCMKQGAFDFLTKPLKTPRFIAVLEHALEFSTLRREVSLLSRRVLEDSLEHPKAFEKIISRNNTIQSIFRYVEAVAPGDRPVLITGESGTGKELIARAIHEISGVKGPFVAVNVAGLEDTVFSDTLFGHKRGAYTGADRERSGLVEKASGGTLFLDEIGDLHPQSQVKLLRLLQERSYYKLGEDSVQQSSTRVVTATNADIRTKMKEGRFRNDLYYRLATHTVHVPPLRDRREDIMPLFHYFLEEASGDLEREPPSVSDEVLEYLLGYEYPGNVRELQSMVYDLVSRGQGKTIHVEDVSPYLRLGGALSAELPPDKEETGSEGEDVLESKEEPKRKPVEGPFSKKAEGPHSFSSVINREKLPSLEEAETWLIRMALEKTGGNQSAAADILKISQSTISRKLKKLEEDQE